MMFEKSERDYPVGMYYGPCQKCGHNFLGPKRERFCALCAKDADNAIPYRDPNGFMTEEDDE